MTYKAPKIQTPFMDPAEKSRPKVKTGPGKTEQAHKQQCDMNYILRDYYASGMIKHAAKYEGKYDDVPAIDFHQAMVLVANAKQMFSELPSNLRNRFNNDPGQFMEFTRNPDNQQEMINLGIIRGNDGVDITGAATGAPVAPPLNLETPPEEKPNA